ncbi:MAG: hypothetical protein QOI27_2417 [Gaiellaceae bacterium]|nr:hypothetical protein [Gaiellaceae bacterium]
MTSAAGRLPTGRLRGAFAAGYCSALAGTRRPSSDLDDWFAEPERRRAPADPEQVPAAQPPPPGSSDDDRDDDRGDDWGDDWLEQGDAPHRRGTGVNLLDTLREWRALVVLVGLAVLLLIGLLVGGVFSSGRTATPPSGTTASTVASTTTAPRTVSTAKTKTTTTAVAPTPSPTTTLTPGDRGPEVIVLQKALASLGYAVGTPDGVYGTSTQSAVAQFQTAAHLTADGVFGPATLAALAGALNGP